MDRRVIRGLLVMAVVIGGAVLACATTHYVNSGESIQTAINAASPGETIVIAAGTYVENLVIDKQLHIIGAGDDTSGTIIQGNPSLGDADVIGIFTGGESEANRLTIQDIRVTGGTSSTGGNLGAGIELATGVGHVLISGVTSIDNDGHGFDFNATAAVSDVHLENCVFEGNGGAGVRIPQSLPSLTNFTLTGSRISDNTGIGVFFYSKGATGITIADCIFERNSSNEPTGGDLVLSGFTGDAVFEHLTFDSLNADSSIRMSGPSTPIGAAGTVVFRDIVIGGTQVGMTYPGAAIAISRYTDGSTISFEDVRLESSGTFGMHLGTLDGTMDLSGVTFDGTYTAADLFLGQHGQQNGTPNSYPFAAIVVDASAAVFVATLDPFAIEDLVYHAMDDSNLGLVVWNPANVYVTPSSGSIQRGIDVVSDGWTVNVASGTYVEPVAITGVNGLSLRGDTGSAPVVDGGGADSVMEVRADDTTISGFEIQNGAFGIYVEGSGGLVLEGNMIHDISNPVFPPGTSGIFLLDSDFASITGNKVYDSPGGITLFYSDFSTILANMVAEANWGIDYYGVGDIVALNSILDGIYGILTDYDSDDGLIGGNVIAGNETGIYVFAAAEPLWIDYPENTGIHLNSIAGNVFGLEYDIMGDPGLIPALDASLNWWGDASGPSGVGPGTGDSVSANVIYSPWLGIDPDAIPSDPDDPTTWGVQLISPMLIIVDDIGPAPEAESIDVPALPGLPFSGTIVLPAGYLNRAIGASNLLVGHDTIEVRHGTYDASEPITDGVTIVSETGSTANTFINGPVDIRAGDILLGRMRQGFTFNGPISVAAGYDASTIHINWNNIYGVVTNGGFNTLDATYNFWGTDGPDTVGAVAVAPILPLTAESIIGYIDGGLTVARAIEVGSLIAEGVSGFDISAAMELEAAFGFSLGEAAAILAEYGYAFVSQALARCGGDYGTFLALLVGYGAPAGGGAALIGGGAGGAVGPSGLSAFVVGDTLPLVITLVDPITGEVMDGAFVTYTVGRQLEDGSYEIVAVGAMSFDGDLGAFTFNLDTTGFEPGVYDIYLGSDDGRQHYLQIEILGE